MALSKLTLSIGLVQIPVEIHNLIGKGTKPSGNYVCAESALPMSGGLGGGKVCDEKHDGACHQVVGYPRPDGTFYVPEDNDLVALNGDKDHLVHLDSFVPVEEVDAAYFEKTYVVKPQKGFESAFWLIAARLEKLKRLAVGTAVLDKDDKLVFLRWSKAFQCLFLCVGAYDEQIRYDLIEGARAGRLTSFKRPEVEMADQLLTKVYTQPFIAADYTPERWHKLTALIEQHGASASGAPVKPTVDGPVPDLMSQLRETLATTTNGKTAAKSKAKSRAKKATKA